MRKCESLKYMLGEEQALLRERVNTALAAASAMQVGLNACGDMQRCTSSKGAQVHVGLTP